MSIKKLYQSPIHMFAKGLIAPWRGQSPLKHHYLSLKGPFLTLILRGKKIWENRRAPLPIEGFVVGKNQDRRCYYCPLQNYGIHSEYICPNFWPVHRKDRNLNKQKEKTQYTSDVGKFERMDKAARKKYGDSVGVKWRNFF